VFQYLETFRVQLKNNFVRQAVYRTNFLTSLIADSIWICIELALFSVIYANTSFISGWTKPQVCFFLGIFFTSDALYAIFFQTNMWNFSNLVNQGELDILLTKPINPLFLALTRSMNLGSILNVIFGLTIASHYATSSGFQGGLHWLKLGYWLTVGVSTALLLRFSFCIWVFWTERGGAFSRLYYQFFTFATKPDSLYPKMIRYTILSVLPFAFIGSVPARALLHGLSLEEHLHILAVLLGFYLLNRTLWRQGLKRYQSASS
jgi:ABC-2 type transport system permease protein